MRSNLIYLEITFKKNRFYYFLISFNSNPWTWSTLILHTKNDLSDAMTVHPVLYPQPNRGVQLFVTIGKKLIIRESTRKNPCEAFTEDTCNDIESYKKILEHYQCQIPFLYFGHNLDDLYAKSLPY